MKTSILSFLILALPIQLFAQFGRTPPPYRVFIELKAGLHREFNKLTDPGKQLNKRAQNQRTSGISAGVYLNDGRTVIGLDYDIVTIGNTLTFRTETFGTAGGRSFQRLTPNLQYYLPLPNLNGRTLITLVGKVGPTITFNGGPRGSNETVEIVFLDTNNISRAFILTESRVNKTFFAGLTLSGGLLYTPNSRLRFTYSISPSVNLTSNDVIIQDVQYRYFNEPTVRNARVLNTGSIITQSISMGYSFGNTKYRKEELQKSRMKYSDEEWEKRKSWSLIFVTSHVFPHIQHNDPAGYLLPEPIERISFGAQVFYRLNTKWQLGTGFESVPYQLDTRPAAVSTELGGSGGGEIINNSYQIPLQTEYTLLRKKGKIKIEWLARAGLAIGLQRKVIKSRSINYNSIYQPPYYNVSMVEEETKDTPSKIFVAGLAGTRLNVYLSKNLFITGYLQQQWALTNNIFHRSRSTYQVGNQQAPLNEAELTTKGTMFLPGFGIGFQL